MLSAFYKRFGPGIIMAAAGVGAGDLITASLGGMKVGTAIFWAPLIGAILKYYLTEGLTRYQMATGETILDGWFKHFGLGFKIFFFSYLIIWTLLVGSALLNAIGVSGDSLLPLSQDPVTSKKMWGIIHVLFGLGLVLKGKYKLFEKIMSMMITIMFFSVMVTAVMLVATKGINLDFRWSYSSMEINWIFAVLGGVGGTLTIICYGYWIKEIGRSGPEGLEQSRTDLVLSYILTGLFSVAMIIIGSTLFNFDVDKSRFAYQLGEILKDVLGPVGRVIFLIGFWSGVFSSLLGCLQSIPYVFADSYYQTKKHKTDVPLDQTRPYFLYLLFISFVPIIGLWFSFQKIQLVYAILGAMFMPFMALSLLLLEKMVLKKHEKFRGRPWHIIAYILTLILFVYLGLKKFL